jgi:hypothetical protein
LLTIELDAEGGRTLVVFYHHARNARQLFKIVGREVGDDIRLAPL